MSLRKGKNKPNEQPWPVWPYPHCTEDYLDQRSEFFWVYAPLGASVAAATAAVAVRAGLWTCHSQNRRNPSVIMFDAPLRFSRGLAADRRPTE